MKNLFLKYLRFRLKGACYLKPPLGWHPGFEKVSIFRMVRYYFKYFIWKIETRLHERYGKEIRDEWEAKHLKQKWDFDRLQLQEYGSEASIEGPTGIEGIRCCPPATEKWAKGYKPWDFSRYVLIPTPKNPRGYDFFADTANKSLQQLNWEDDHGIYILEGGR